MLLNLLPKTLKERLGLVPAAAHVDATSRFETELAARLQIPLEELKKRWGFGSLRRGQAQAIERLLEGGDVLAVMPTGSGKSLIYQLASQCLPGLTIVVSPLIALMSDQLRSLEQRGVSAVALSSQHAPEENQARLGRALSGQTRLLYLAPERLRSESFREQLQGANVSLFVVDEAHCITDWGHDFRPDYLSLARSIEGVGRPPVVALTATATPAAQREIVDHLHLRTPLVVATGFDRPNLLFRCIPAPGERKLAILQTLLSRRTGPALVYAGTRKATEEIAEALRPQLTCPVLCYHGGMESSQRQAALATFSQARDLVMVATNAFGMGVDRSDLGLVIHHSLPGSLEAYYQEAGRAGRGGQSAMAILLYDPNDRSLHDYFIRQASYTAEDYEKLLFRLRAGKRLWTPRDRAGLDHLEKEAVVEAHAGGWRVALVWSPKLARKVCAHSERVRKMRTQLLAEMIDYATTTTCRRRRLVGHFGQTLFRLPRPCCDNCGG